MRYIGNKTKLLSFIENVMVDTVGPLEDKTLCDLFAGSTSVARYFKQKCRKVIANDLESYSYVLAKHYLGNNQPMHEKHRELIQYLNCLEGKTGLFTENFSPHGVEGRKFFTVENAGKIDAMRDQLDDWKVSGEIDDNMYYFLLASLLESVDKYANTTGVYGAFLKEFNGRSTHTLEVKPAEFYLGSQPGQVFQQDSNIVLPNLSGDILYLDPPYNTRQYSSNYHILNYVVDNKVDIKNNREGKQSRTALPTEYNKSPFSTRSGVKKAFEDLISKSEGFKWVFLSYNDEGLLSLTDIRKVFQKYGKYNLTNTDHMRYNSGGGKNKDNPNKMINRRKNTVEYLHILERQ